MTERVRELDYHPVVCYFVIFELVTFLIFLFIFKNKMRCYLAAVCFQLMSDLHISLQLSKQSPKGRILLPVIALFFLL